MITGRRLAEELPEMSPEPSIDQVMLTLSDLCAHPSGYSERVRRGRQTQADWPVMITLR
jgi:hypothetical protein